MAENPITESALDKLEEAEFVTEFQEGSNRAKMLSPEDLLKLHELESRLAADESRRTSGIYRIIR